MEGTQRLPIDLGPSNNLVLRPGPNHQFPGCLVEGSGLALKAEADRSPRTLRFLNQHLFRGPSTMFDAPS